MVDCIFETIFRRENPWIVRLSRAFCSLPSTLFDKKVCCKLLQWKLKGGWSAAELEGNWTFLNLWLDSLNNKRIERSSKHRRGDWQLKKGNAQSETPALRLLKSWMKCITSKFNEGGKDANLRAEGWAFWRLQKLEGWGQNRGGMGWCCL